MNVETFEQAEIIVIELRSVEADIACWSGATGFKVYGSTGGPYTVLSAENLPEGMYHAFCTDDVVPALQEKRTDLLDALDAIDCEAAKAALAKHPEPK